MKWRIECFECKYNKHVNQSLCYSDESEFLCSGFIAKLGQIAAYLNVTIIWNFTGSCHGKGKHDGEGHINSNLILEINFILKQLPII